VPDKETAGRDEAIEAVIASLARYQEEFSPRKESLPDQIKIL